VFKSSASVVAGGLLACGLAPFAVADVTVYNEGDKRVEVGGRVHLQYLHVDLDNQPSEDETFFRRLRVYVAGTVTKNWFGKIEADFGAALDADEVAVTDAYMRYTGFKADGMQLTIGNQKPPFSREFNTSSNKRQTVERPFTGDHNFGNPDRFIGFRFDGLAAARKLGYSVAAGQEHHDPDVRFIDFDTPTNTKEDWNEGSLLAATLTLFPWGPMQLEQCDFDAGRFKANFSVAAYTWNNDGDNNSYTDDSGNALNAERADLDSADGWELSADLRGHGLSVTGAVNRITGDTVDPAFSGGIYTAGTTDLDQLSLIGGYMVIKQRFEVVLGWQSQDADGYAEEWTRTQVGLNYFYNQHKVKAQLNYSIGENVFGQSGVDTDTTQLQLQYYF